MKKSLFIFQIAMLIAITSSSFCSIHYLRPKKTGSTTLASLLREHFDQEQLYRSQKKRLCSVSNYSEANQLLNSMRNVREDDLVLGHFPMWFFEQKVDHDEDCYWFVTLRDPVERVLSQYRYMKNKNLPIFSPYDIQPNHMCRILASDPTLSEEDLLQSAISNLHKMNLVIFLDDFEHGIRRLFEDLTLPQPVEIPKKNSTYRAQAHPATIEKLQQINSLDVLLYEYAKTHFGRD